MRRSPVTPMLVGAALTTYGSSLGGILGMRFGGAYDIRSFAGSSTTADAERGWVADADAVISPARFPVIGPLLGGFLPTVFSGIGVEGLRRTDGAGGQSVVTSYGVGVSRTLGGFAFETEARRRIPVTLGGTAAEENAITQPRLGVPDRHVHRIWRHRPRRAGFRRFPFQQAPVPLGAPSRRPPPRPRR